VFVSCLNFIELCSVFMVEDEKVFEIFLCNFGLLVDWLM